jgi:DNA-binding transcriptional LysR family regulator
VTVGVIPRWRRWLTALTRFRQRYPNVELAVREEPTVRLKELLIRGGVDFAVIVDDDQPLPALSTARLFTESSSWRSRAIIRLPPQEPACS